jgi:hypothetical protein
MKFKLKLLYRYGVALTLEELADASLYIGNLAVDDWPQDSTVGECIHQARLLDMTTLNTPRDLIPPLYDPQIVKIKNNHMMLLGYQIHVGTETGAIRHYAQSWLLRAITEE